jgi:glutathione S-transferase
VLEHLGVAFEEETLSLYDAETRARIRQLTPSGKLPVLHDGELRVWESLAICEYLAEKFPDRGLWPSEPAARAYARSVSHEMHAGFGALRSSLPMNLRRRFPTYADAPGLAADIARVQEIWCSARERYGKAAGGDFLFGPFGIADAMYAPVVTRFQTYNVTLSAEAQRYADAVLALPAMQKWTLAAQHERWVLPAFEK